MQFLGAVPKQRVDLLPYYARFAAILTRYMPDIGAGLIAIVSEPALDTPRQAMADVKRARPSTAR